MGGKIDVMNSVDGVAIFISTKVNKVLVDCEGFYYCREHPSLFMLNSGGLGRTQGF